jgi:hypothetical protein
MPILTTGLKVLEEFIGREQVELLLANTYRFIGMESVT